MPQQRIVKKSTKLLWLQIRVAFSFDPPSQFTELHLMRQSCAARRQRAGLVAALSASVGRVADRVGDRDNAADYGEGQSEGE
jgi:hypothetical protein